MGGCQFIVAELWLTKSVITFLGCDGMAKQEKNHNREISYHSLKKKVSFATLIFGLFLRFASYMYETMID